MRDDAVQGYRARRRLMAADYERAGGFHDTADGHGEH
jgi:hypothetical protein